MGKETAGRSNYEPITEEEVNAAQSAWCDALVTLGQVYSEGGDYKAIASRLIDEQYDYREGTVFFKPTLAFGANAFRSTRKAHCPISSAATRTFRRIRVSRSSAG